MGSMTGRGAGYCTGNGMPGSMNSAAGRGAGFGAGRGGAFGAGRGRRFGFNYPVNPGPVSGGGDAGVSNPNPESVRLALKNQAEALSSELELVKQRLSELESETTAE